jgi:hypothetical protein
MDSGTSEGEDSIEEGEDNDNVLALVGKLVATCLLACSSCEDEDAEDDVEVEAPVH